MSRFVITEADLYNIVESSIKRIFQEGYNPLGNIDVDLVDNINFTRNYDEEGDEDEDGNPIPYITYDLDCYDRDWENLGSVYDFTLEDIEEYFGEYIAQEIQNNGDNDKGQLTDILMYNMSSFDINNVEEVNEVAKKLWKTYDYADAVCQRGYILTNGTLLFFGPNVDHVSISSIDGMTVGKFVSLGNIRVFNSGFELEKEPTLQQRRALKLLIQNNESDEVSFDIVEYQGKGMYSHTIASGRYITHRPNIVLSQIDNYFVNGIKPKEYFEESKRKRPKKQRVLR